MRHLEVRTSCVGCGIEILVGNQNKLKRCSNCRQKYYAQVNVKRHIDDVISSGQIHKLNYTVRRLFKLGYLVSVRKVMK